MKVVKVFHYLILLFITISYSQAQVLLGAPNPASAYCESLGYEGKIVKDAIGAELCVCIFPDGTEVEQFDFYKGKVGEKWSYGAKYGYHVMSKEIDIDGMSFTFAFCIKYDSSGKVIEEIPQILLMKLNKEPYYIDSNTELLERALN